MATETILSSSHLGHEKKLQTIIGKDATVSKVASEMEEFFYNCSQNVILFLCWAGHGASERDEGTGLLSQVRDINLVSRPVPIEH